MTLAPIYSEDAEQAVLGAGFMDPPALAIARGILTAESFYRSAHAKIFAALSAIADRGEVPDPLLLAAQLEQMGELEAVGGKDYIGFLVDAVPTAANVEYHAKIVRDKAERRNVIAVAESMIEGARDPKLRPDAVAQQATSDLLPVAAHTKSKGFVLISDVLVGVLEDIWNRRNTPHGMAGVTWGYDALDFETGGQRPGELAMHCGVPGSGKALALDTPLPTPTGWTIMGDVQVGDSLFDEQGNPCRVTAISPVYRDHTVYDVVFSDGTIIRADADHRWFTSSKRARRVAAARKQREGSPVSAKARPQPHARVSSVVTTEQIRSSMGYHGANNHAVKVAGALNLPDADLPIDPYVLGAWLGDGNSAASKITVSDADAGEMFSLLAAAGTAVSGKPYRHPGDKCATYPIGGHGKGRGRVHRSVDTGLQIRLRQLGVLKNKHIPSIYLRASYAQRLALLQGLMDTDGTCSQSGTCSITSCRSALAVGIHELILSLGLKATMQTGRAKLKGKDCGKRYVIAFTTRVQVFRLKRKRDRQVSLSRPTQDWRYIVDVRPAPTVPVKCVAVDSPSHLYLAGLSFVPTHNTAFVVNRAVRVAKRGKRVAIISAEMGVKRLVERILNTDARINSKAARKGEIDVAEWDYMVKVGVTLKNLPLHIDDTAQPNMRDIRAKVRALKAKYPDLALVVVDFVQLLKDTGDDNRSLELTEISYGLQGLGKETETAMDVTCQVDAAAIEKREDKRPQLSDLRWSQGMREASDFVDLMYNPTLYDVNALSVIEQSWRKVRDAAPFTSRLRWIPEYVLIDDMPVRAVA